MENTKPGQSEASNLTYSVDGSDCGFELKPFGKFEECGDSVVAECSASVCGNAVKEGAKDCEPALSFEDDCCLSDCTRSASAECLRSNKQFDAAFTDSGGRLFLFQGTQFSVYSGLASGDSIGAPDAGFPKLIADLFPIASWNGSFDAAFCTPDDIAYVFKQFSFVRIELDAAPVDRDRVELV